MKSLFNKFFGRVIKVRIHGQINQKMVEKVFLDFRSAYYLPVSAVVVVINSNGGSLTQSNNIVDMLNNFSAFKKVPFYCFVEDFCLGPANLILTSGEKCYASNMSIIGSFGFSWTSIGTKKFLQKFNIKKQSVVGGQNKIQYDHLSDMEPQAQQLIINQLANLQKEMKDQILHNRNKQLTKNQTSSEQFQNEIFKQSVFKVEEGVKLGYLDGIMNYEDYYEEYLSGKKQFIVNGKRQYKWIRYVGLGGRMDSLK